MVVQGRQGFKKRRMGRVRTEYSTFKCVSKITHMRMQAIIRSPLPYPESGHRLITPSVAQVLTCEHLRAQSPTYLGDY